MRNTHLTVLTGASRGLGRALAEQVLRRPGHQRLLSISRSPDASLGVIAQEASAELEQWAMDFHETVLPATRLAAWLQTCNSSECASATLINNAGIVASLGPLDMASVTEITSALRVGLEAPMLLTGAFLRATASWSVVRKVLSISSSAGRKVVVGQSSYGAAKAGMDHFVQVVAEEQATRPNGALMVSVAPGNIDTDMQTQLRASNPAHFPAQGRLVQLKAEGRLRPPAEVAEKMLKLLARQDFGYQPVLDIHDLD